MNENPRSDADSTGWDTSVGQLMSLFWKSLRAVTPVLMEARFEVGDDGWDAITEPLFDQVVEESIRYSDAVTDKATFDLPTFEFEFDPAGTSHIAVRPKAGGEWRPFRRFGSTYHWPDFTVVERAGAEEHLRLADCEWSCLLREGSGERRVTTLRVDAAAAPSAGAQPTRPPGEPAKQRMPLDEWHRWWKHFGQLPLRHMMLLYWDPIGVYGADPAVDEYDGYVGKVGAMLGDGATAEEIASYLKTTASQSMGMPAPRSNAAAQRIVEWYDESIQRFIQSIRVYGKRDR